MDSSVAITVAAHTSLGTWPDLRVRLRGAEAGVAAEAHAAGEMLGAFGLTEPEAGSDAGNVAHARRSSTDGEWVIDGAKQFITNAGTDISGFVTITAQTGDDEISNIIVPNGHARLRDRRGLPQDGLERLGHAAARRSTTAACPRRTCSARAGWASSSSCRRSTAAGSASSAMGVGLAQGALDEALAYAKERQAFGKPISKYQAIQIKLADMSTEIEAARLLTYKAALEKDAGQATSSLTAAQAKLKTGRLAVRAAEEAVQIHGGYGYIEEYPVCRFYRDAKILTIGEGTDEVQQMVIARALGLRPALDPRHLRLVHVAGPALRPAAAPRAGRGRVDLRVASARAGAPARGRRGCGPRDEMEVEARHLQAGGVARGSGSRRASRSRRLELEDVLLGGHLRERPVGRLLARHGAGAHRLELAVDVRAHAGPPPARSSS